MSMEPLLPHDIEETEFAACMAGVYAYIRAAEDEQASFGIGGEQGMSPWLAAARLEQTGRAHQLTNSYRSGRRHASPLWSAPLLAIIFLLVICIPSFAQ